MIMDEDSPRDMVIFVKFQTYFRPIIFIRNHMLHLHGVLYPQGLELVDVDPSAPSAFSHKNGVGYGGKTAPIMFLIKL